MGFQRLDQLHQQAVVANVTDGAVHDVGHHDLVLHALAQAGQARVHAVAAAELLAGHLELVRRDGDQLAQADGLRAALDEHLHGCRRRHQPPAALVGGVADQHLAAQAQRLDAGGQVHRLADHRVFGIHVRPKAPGHHGACVHADAQKHLGQALGQVGKVQLAHGNLHLHRTQQRTVHIVLAGHRRAKQHHDRVTHELVDGALVLEHDLRQPCQAAVERRNDHRRRL